MSSFIVPSLPQWQRKRRRTFVSSARGLETFLKAPFQELEIGSVVVPRHLWDLRMRKIGVYRSVEYRIESMSLDSVAIQSTRYVSRSRLGDVIITLRPVSRLLPRFERKWPAQVSIRDAKLVSYKADLLNCALVTLGLSAGFLGIGFYGPRFIGIYSIPSASMAPTLKIGDALLVEKMSLKRDPPHRGEIVLFRPTKRLAQILERYQQSSSTRFARETLFVKRVIAVAGDTIEVQQSGIMVNGVIRCSTAPKSPNVSPKIVPHGYVFVVGDNQENSIDSRYWGFLPVGNIVGRPMARIFPPDRLELGV